VDVNHDIGASAKGSLDQVVILCKECGVKRGGRDIVADEVLPSDRQTDTVLGQSLPCSSHQQMVNILVGSLCDEMGDLVRARAVRGSFG
jgi:hypothetical protein